MEDLKTQFEIESGETVTSVEENGRGSIVVQTEEGNQYVVYDEEVAYETEKEMIEDFLTETDELKAFLAKIGISKSFLLDEAAYDYFKDFDEEELQEAGLAPLDTIENSDFINFLDDFYSEGSDYYLAEHPEYLDFDAIANYIIESDGLLFLSGGEGYEEKGDGIVWFQAY